MAESIRALSRRSRAMRSSSGISFHTSWSTGSVIAIRPEPNRSMKNRSDRSPAASAIDRISSRNPFEGISRKEGNFSRNGATIRRVSAAVSRSIWTMAESRSSFKDIAASAFLKIPGAVFRRHLPRNLLHRRAHERFRVRRQPRDGPRHAADLFEPELALFRRPRLHGPRDPPGDLRRRLPQTRFRLEAHPVDEIVIEGELEDPLVESGIRKHVRPEQHRRPGDLPAQLDGGHLVHPVRDPRPLLPDRHLLVLFLGQIRRLEPFAVLLFFLELRDRVCGVGRDERLREIPKLRFGEVLAVPGEQLLRGLLVDAVPEDPHRVPQLRVGKLLEVLHEVGRAVLEAAPDELDVGVHGVPR